MLTSVWDLGQNPSFLVYEFGDPLCFQDGEEPMDTDSSKDKDSKVKEEKEKSSDSEKDKAQEKKV